MFRYARLMVHARRVAKRCAVTLTACMGTALWCTGWMAYTAFGLIFSTLALVVTAGLAAVAWVVSGE